jgi:hypothetical protein
MPLYNPPRPNLFIGPLAPYLITGNTFNVSTASAANLYAFVVDRPITVTAAYVRIGTQSGNIDLGIYDSAGNRLGSTGSTACPAASITVSIALTAATALGVGTFYAAIAADNTTAAFGGLLGISTPTVPGQNLMGQVATSFPLPSTIALSSGNSIANRLGIWFA